MQYKMQLVVNRDEVNIYLWVLIYVKGPKEKIKDIVVLGRVAYLVLIWNREPWDP